MSAAGWIEIALYVAILTAITPVLGRYMAWVYRGPSLWPEQDWKAYARSVLVASAVFFGLLYLILRPRMPYPDAPYVQHDGVLHHQHELAVLCGRDDALEPPADGGSDGAELRLGGGRHRRRDRLHPRARRALGHDASATSTAT